jgi:hypothetical protein
MNTVDEDIQMTSDCPSDNARGMCPGLDMSMYMSDNRVMFTFYSKPMATTYVIPARSAHTERTKRSTLTQEGVRRLLCVSPDLSENVRARVMTEFDPKMRHSGYLKGFRWNILQSAYLIYDEKVKQSTEGVRPLYKPREYRREEREKVKAASRLTWYRGKGDIPNKAPLIIDPTPTGQMAVDMQNVIKDFKHVHGIGIKMVERGGEETAVSSKVRCPRKEGM